MIDKNILFAISIITGNQITSDTEYITFFIEKFADKKLVPTSTKQNEHDILKLSNSEEGIIITFLPDRIVFVKMFNSTHQKTSISEFCTYIIEIWSTINEKHQISANRLGIASRVLFKELPQEVLQDIYSKIFVPFNDFNFDKPIGWTKESISQITRQIGDIPEELNVVTELRRLQGSFNDNENSPSFDRIELGVHINTIEGNTDYRFKVDNIKRVFDGILELHTELTNLITNHIK